MVDSDCGQGYGDLMLITPQLLHQSSEMYRSRAWRVPLQSLQCQQAFAGAYLFDFGAMEHTSPRLVVQGVGTPGLNELTVKE